MSASDVVSPQGVDVPTKEELIERARALRPLLEEDAAQGDRDRGITDRVAAAMAEAGLSKLMVPKRLGGYETDAVTLTEVVAEVGKGDLSAAWVLGVQNWSAYQIGLYPEQAQRDVWESDPEARACWVMSPAVQHEPVEGGIVVSGQWANASASAHCEWAVLSVPMSFGPQGPVWSMALIPMSDLATVDTWFTAGVRGSASNTLVADKAFVPEHRLLPLDPIMDGACFNGHPEESLYRSAYSIGGFAILAPQLGAVAGMLEAVTAKAAGKMIPAAMVMDMSEWPAFQIELAKATARFEAARLLALQAAEHLDAAAKTGELPTDVVRGEARFYPAWASHEAREVAEVIMDEAGASAFADGDQLQRMWRDVATANRHTGFRVNPNAELFGRILLGKGPNNRFMF